MEFISELTGLALRVTDIERSTSFYTEVWGLEVHARLDRSVQFRGTGARAPVLTLSSGNEPGLEYLTFAASSPRAVKALEENLIRLGYAVLAPAGTDFPEGRSGLACCDADGREIRVVGQPGGVLSRSGFIAPIGLNHVVLNSPNGKDNLRFFTKGLGMRVTDTLSYLPMSFLGCNHLHHCVALWDGAPRAFLNHVAFEVPDVEAFLRQTAQLIKRGCHLIAGPGRHTAGDNTFSYFLDPDGIVIEITTGMEVIHDREKWIPRTWLTGEDQWGFGKPLASEEMRKHTV